MRVGKFIITLLATNFYTGFSPRAPGTIGSIAGMIYALILLFTLNKHVTISLIHTSDNNPDFLGQVLLYSVELFALATLAVIILSYFVIRSYLKLTSKEDPKEVVIDEIAGIFFQMALTSGIIFFQSLHGFLFYTLGNLFFFRFYDIVKPWPVNWIDKNVKGARGVLGDDLAAAILGSLAVYMTFFVYLKFVNHPFFAS